MWDSAIGPSALNIIMMMMTKIDIVEEGVGHLISESYLKQETNIIDRSNVAKKKLKKSCGVLVHKRNNINRKL
jgi:hypothetical protein